MMLTDPRLFNYIILTLYLLNAGRWAWEGKWVDCLYWLGVLFVTAVVVFGYNSKYA